MAADTPTILATSGGIGYGRRTRFAFTALTDFAVELSGVTGRTPKVCLLATAMGDDKAVLHYLTEAAQEQGFTPSHLSLFPMPNVEDVTAHLLDQDVVWVFGGSVAGLLAMWRLHGLGFVPYANGVHYASEDQRRPLLHSLVGAGPCLRHTPPTTEPVCCIAARNSSKLSAKRMVQQLISSRQSTLRSSRRCSTSEGYRRAGDDAASCDNR
jgi:hypothetical protein